MLQPHEAEEPGAYLNKMSSDVTPASRSRVGTPDTPPKVDESALLYQSEPVYVFQSLRSQMTYIRDEYTQAWKWKGLEENVETVKQHLLDYAAHLQEASKQIDRCYFQLAVYPDQVVKCVETMSALEGNANDLWTQCETFRIRLEETTATLEDTREENKQIRDRLDAKTEECNKNKSLYEEQLCLRKDFERKYYDTRTLLEEEREVSAMLRQKITLLEKDILQLNHAKKERIIRAVRLMDLERTEGLMSFIFGSIRRVVGMERMERLAKASDDALRTEIEKLDAHKQSITAKLVATEDQLELRENEIERLKRERIESGVKRLRKLLCLPANLQFQQFIWDDWNKMLPTLKCENKLRLIEEDYDKAKASSDEIQLQCEEMRNKFDQVTKEYIEFKEFHRQQRKESLLAQLSQVVWLRCQQTTTIREVQAKAKKQFDEAIQYRDERILLLEKWLREDLHVTAYEKHCHEMEWEMEQSLQGPPSKVVARGTGVLCSSCSRQVVYQAYISADNNEMGIEPDPDTWNLSVMDKTERTPSRRSHRVWLP